MYCNTHAYYYAVLNKHLQGFHKFPYKGVQINVYTHKGMMSLISYLLEFDLDTNSTYTYMVNGLYSKLCQLKGDSEGHARSCIF